MAQGPTKIRKNAGKANTERANKPRRSPNGLKNPAIQKLRNVNKLVKIGKIETLLVSKATNEHFVFVQKPSRQKTKKFTQEEKDRNANSMVDDDTVLD